MRFSTTLFVLFCAISLPACFAAGADSLDPALGFDHDFDLGPSIDLGESGESGADASLEPGFDRFDSPFDPAFDPRLEPECGCVFPSRDHDPIAVICGAAICFEELSYFCTYEGTAVSIGACIGLTDGDLDLTGYEFPRDEPTPSSCQGNAGACSGDTALTCEDKVGCTFLPNGECIGAPLACSSRIQAACTTFGDGCFHVSPFAL